MRKTKRNLPTVPEILLKRPKTQGQWQMATKKGSILPRAWSKKDWRMSFKLLKLGK